MFEFTGLGLALLALGCIYLQLFSRWLLPERPGTDAEALFELGDFIAELAVVGDAVVGKSVDALNLPQRVGLTPIDVIRGSQRLWKPGQLVLQSGDVIRVSGAVRDLAQLDISSGLQLHPEHEHGSGLAQDQQRRLVHVMLPARSPILGHAVRELGLSERYNAILLAVRRDGAPIVRKLSDVRFESGDVALFLTTRDGASTLQASRDFVVLREEHRLPARVGSSVLPVSVAAVAVLIAALGWLPIYLTAILGCIVLILCRALTAEEAFEAVQWRVLFLIAGMLPLGLAMESSGLATLAVKHFFDFASHASPMLVLSLLYLLTAVMTEFLSNVSAAVLLFPVALSIADHFGVDAKPFIVAVTFAASNSFTTPVGYQTNTMVYNAGNYRFMDFVRIGLPLNLLFWIAASFLIPWFFPFRSE